MEISIWHESCSNADIQVFVCTELHFRLPRHTVRRSSDRKRPLPASPGAQKRTTDCYGATGAGRSATVDMHVSQDAVATLGGNSCAAAARFPRGHAVRLKPPLCPCQVRSAADFGHGRTNVAVFVTSHLRAPSGSLPVLPPCLPAPAMDKQRTALPPLAQASAVAAPPEVGRRCRFYRNGDLADRVAVRARARSCRAAAGG